MTTTNVVNARSIVQALDELGYVEGENIVYNALDAGSDLGEVSSVAE